LNTVDPATVSVRMAMLVAADIAAGLLLPDSKVALIYKGAEIIDLPCDENEKSAGSSDAGDDAEISRIAKNFPCLLAEDVVSGISSAGLFDGKTIPCPPGKLT
jgi:hypothetical protein